ncbi:MAG TPA: GspE/PulE family protein [Candidatus Paceibacterota bacterium]
MTVIFNEEKQNQKLDEIRDAEKEDLSRELSKKYSLPYIDLSVSPINIDALRVVREDVARKAEVAPFNIVDKRVALAIFSPNNPMTIEVIEDMKRRGFIPNLFMSSKDSLEKVWLRYKDLSYSFETKSGAIDISNEEILSITENVRHIEDVKKMIEEVLSQKKSYRISKILEIILAGAIALNASDVHLEPEDTYVRLRYRLDGVLKDILNFDSDTYKLLISRIKLTSEMKLNTKEKAQDGRFSIKIRDEEIEIRSSIIPGAYSESVVLRVLNPNAISVPLEELGIPDKLLENILHELRKPNGMILNTGPTGSGKTTTLYAFLKKIHTPDIKIITIENPIEYHLPGIVQTQTNEKEGYTFLEGLRSALRQDPDVIMVGEIRDSETAEIAVNAALTGHLVFSTLHTNNAAGTFPRLVDLGVNSKVITSAINIAMAQRLVRKLCPDCRKEYIPKPQEKEIVDKILSGVKDRVFADNLHYEKFFEPGGCEKCNMSGYKGRIGIFEAIITDENIEKIVRENPSEREINQAAENQGMLTMKQDGVIKVIKGVTSLEELERVIDLWG